MITTYPFSTRDEDQALKNAIWINELGGCKEHEVVVCYDPRCSTEKVEAIGLELLKTFGKVYRLPAEFPMDGWPQGANYLFRLCATWLQNRPQYPYYLWLEPDAIPISPGWMDALEAEYKRGGKAFMGERVDLGEKRPDVPVHMSGIGIYQNPIYLLAGEAYRAHEVAWDIAAKDQIIPHAHWTKLIQHYWKHGTFTNLEGVRPETVVFHSSKDGSLIDLLRRPQRATEIPRVQGFLKQIDQDLATPEQRPPSQIKVLPHNGIWVLDGDTIISDEVERHGRLDFDSLIPNVLSCIRPGDTVVDVGAFIGDHTVAYSHAVGKSGKVIAYEPNPLAYQCLIHNTQNTGNVFTFCTALGSERQTLRLTDLPNAASNYIGDGREVHVRPMDEDASLFLQINLIKIDVEGYELKVLQGAEKLIEKFHPTLVIEINEIALGRQYTTKENIFYWLEAHGYGHTILHQHKDAPFYDILALPQKPPESQQDTVAHSTAPAPVAAQPTVREEIEWHVGVLKQFAEHDPQHKSIVMQKLVYAGLRPPNKKKKHASTKTHQQANGKRRPTT